MTCQISLRPHDYRSMTYIPDIPEQPERPTILLMLTYDQADAIRDAVTAFALATDGNLEAIQDTYAKKDGPDMGEANRWVDLQVELAYEVHHMIDEQQKPYMEKFSRWWKLVRRHYESHGHEGRMRG